MPYTPPSTAQSPASSRNSTPSLSRNASYTNAGDLMVNTSSHSPTSTRPNLPRSLSSAAYLSKHRRSPSVTSPTEPSAPLHIRTGRPTAVRDAESLTSLRQSPPPVNNLVIPTGAIISPPDSSENSDGDEQNERRSRKSEVESTWNDLQKAVRSMSLQRDSSPAKLTVLSSSEPTTQVTSPNSLTTEARKISHSRSSTETAIIVSRPSFTESANATSGSEESDEDEGGFSKPPLVRKKSGELVKPALRPSSRRRYSSMPGTPTYSKSVHFNDNGNQTRHFLQVDKPSAVSADTSPTDTAYESENEYPFVETTSSKLEWEIKLTNFPENRPDRQHNPIWVESLALSPDNKSLIGQVAVANISFSKAVTARFTLDYWKTTSEVSAEYSHDVRNQNANDGYDRFSFSIRLVDQANLENKTLLLCVRYNVSGQEFWDSNDNLNYQIDFARRTTKVTTFAPASQLGARPANAIPRSRHSPPASRGRTRAPAHDDDMGRGNNSSAYHFVSSANDLLDDSQATIKLKPRTKRSVGFNSASPQQAPGGLGGRYDFGASLSAALSNAQDKLGRSSGLMHHGQRQTSQRQSNTAGYFPTEAQAAAAQRPDNASTERPAIGSAQYKDLVSKFCYFTPPTAGKLSPVGTKPGNTDGSDETEPEPSGSSTPSPPSGLPNLDGASDVKGSSPYISPYSSRTASPSGASRRGLGPKSHSTTSFYTYKRDGYLAESHAPTAIRG